MPREGFDAGSVAAKSIDNGIKDSSLLKQHLADTQDSIQRHDEDHATSRKRQRVSWACDQCRIKKDRCDGIRPSCSTCTILKRPCSYKSNPKKRGLPTGYIRSLELLWGAVFSMVQGGEETFCELLRTSDVQSQITTMIKDNDGSNTFMSKWKQSTAFKDIERLLTTLDRSDGEFSVMNLDDNGVSVAGQSSLSDALKKHHWRAHCTPLDTSQGTDVSNEGRSIYSTERADRRLAQPTQYRNSSSQTTTERSPNNPGVAMDPTTLQSDNVSKRDPGLQLPSNAWGLFDIYFTYVHYSLPMVEKHEILRTAFCYNEGHIPVSCGTQGSGSHATLWAILALASLQDQYAKNSGQSRDLRGSGLHPEEIYEIARQLIPFENDNFELGHIQASLILALIRIGRRDWIAAWMLVGHAIRISYALGIDRQVPSTSERPSMGNLHGRQKHVFLSCFVLDTMIASQMERVPELRTEQIMEFGLLLEDGLEEWQPWEEPNGVQLAREVSSSAHRGPASALSTFNRLCSLCCLLGSILRWKPDDKNASSQLQLIKHNMDHWVMELPKALCLNIQANETVLPPHILGIHLAYESVAAVFLMRSNHLAKRRTTTTPGRHAPANSEHTAILRLFLKKYGLAASTPLFSVYLSLNPSMYDSGPGIHPDIDVIGSELRHVWESQQSVIPAVNLDYMTSQRPPHSNVKFGNDSRYQPSIGFTAENQLHSDCSMGVMSSPQISSLENPCQPSILKNQVSQVSVQQDRMETIDNHFGRANLVTSSNTSGMILSGSAFPLHGHGRNPQNSFHDTDNNLHTLEGDLDGYDSGRARAAPDLDALFDELASLDGGDKAENHPRFMQNLGFAPSVGMSDLFSDYNDDFDTLLMAPTQ